MIGDLADKWASGDPIKLKGLEKKRAALRGYNSNLSHITVRTYDELITMAEAIRRHTQRVIERVAAAEEEAAAEDDGKTAKGEPAELEEPEE